MILTTQQIEAAFKWDAGKEVQTKRGPRLLRKAPVTPEAEQFYSMNRSEMYAAGVSLSEWPRGSGRWGFSYWQEIDPEKLAAAQHAKSAAIAASRATDSDIEIPVRDGLGYLPFQRAGVAFAAAQFAAGKHALIGDEMGLGKTIQAPGTINADPAITPVLIVCPASLKGNWRNELNKWLVRPLSIGIADGKCFPSTDVVIVNFDVVHKWGKSLLRMWDLVVIDEAQRVKNRKARRTKSIFGYKPGKNEPVTEAKAAIPARRKLVLTGTPIENNPDEIWTVLNFLDPARWPSYWKFAARYCGLEHNRFGVQLGRGQNLDELNEILRQTCMIRRLKADVLTDLPPKFRSIQEMEVNADDPIILRERQYRDEFGDEAFDDEEVALEIAKAGTDQEFEAASAKLQSRRDQRMAEISRLRHETALAKVTRLGLAEQLAEEAREIGKVVIFGHHRDVLEAVHSAFAPGEAVIVDGSVDPLERTEIVKRFQTDPSFKAFIGSIRACGEGITLTAASNVWFAEEDWTPGRMVQCEDRCHRIGQRDNVSVRHYVVNGSLDAHMVKTIVRKQEVITQVLDTVVEEKPAIQPATELENRNGRGLHVSPQREELDRIAAKLTPENVRAIHDGLRWLAGCCDGAHELDGAGFNKLDTRIGKDLASREFLTPRQASLGLKLCNKYRRQLGGKVVEI